MINVLYDTLPDYVEISGKRYPVITDFREWIRLAELVDDDSVPDVVKVRLLLMWYTGDVPEELESAINALGDFLIGSGLCQSGAGDCESKNITPAFSYSEDAGCIYSAFRECYGIDLQTIGYMHWWKFQTLFDWLPESTEIKQRMMYRTMNLSDIKDKDERKRVKRIQDRIQLKKKRKYMSDFEIGDAFS